MSDGNISSPASLSILGATLSGPLRESPESTVFVLRRHMLGQLLSILYLNDLPNASKIINFILFADDTNAFISHKDPNTMISILNTKLLIQLTKSEQIIINIKKTHNMIFTPRQRKPHNLDNNILR